MSAATHLPDSQSARESLREGRWYALMIGSGETYLGAAAVFLGAQALQIGLLATLPPLIGAIAQISSLRFLDAGVSRRRMVTFGAYLGAGMMMLMALTCLFGRDRPAAMMMLIFCAAVYYVGTGIATPAWSSLIGDLVSSPGRVHFFALRNRRVGGWAFVSSLVAGNFLALAERIGSSAFGFGSTFLAAGIARVFSARSLSRHEDPPYKPEPEAYFSFLNFLRRTRHSNFAKFAFFYATVNFGMSIAGPYFTPYMLRDLQLNYVVFSVLGASAIASQFLAMRKWGRYSERFGNRKILSICGIGVGIVPMLWLVSTNVVFLFFIQIFAGLVWAGFNLASQSFLYDSVSRAKLARCAAYQAALNGAFVFGGSLLGAYLHELLDHSPQLLASLPLVANSSEVLFLLSGAVRLLAVLIVLPTFREVRELEPQVARERTLIFRISHLRPVIGAVYSVVAEVRRPRKGRAKAAAAKSETVDRPAV